MTALTLDTLSCNVKQVLASKAKGSELYLDKFGALSEDIKRRASIVELFYRSRQFFREAISNPKKWEEYVLTVVQVLDHEYKGPQASFLFMRLMAPAGISIFRSRFNESLSTLSVACSWISEHCMQDLFIMLMHETKTLEHNINTALAALPHPIQDYFLNPDIDLKLGALKKIFELKPTSRVGEILYSRLKAQTGENALYFPHEMVPGIPLTDFSVAKVSSFADRGFIDELLARFSEAHEGLEEIHRFCKSLKDFAHVYFLYKKHESATKVVISFTKSYMPMIKDLTKERDLSPEKRFPLLISRMSRHPFSARMFDTICLNFQTNQRLSKVAGYSDHKFDEEVDIAPFLSLTEEYFASYRPFFKYHLSHLHGAHMFEKKFVYKEQLPKEVSAELKIVSCFDARFQKVDEAFLGPSLPEFLPSLDAWNRYIETVQKFLDKAYKIPSLEADPKAIKALKKILQSAVDPAPLEVGGGGARAEVVITNPVLDEEPEESVSAQQEQTRLIFGAAKSSKALDLYAEIGKEAFSFSYAPRVLNWFEAPEEVLALEPYNTMDASSQKTMVQIHAFSLKVDHFLKSRYCQKRIWRNAAKVRDEDLYVIPGYMSIDGINHKGVFEYCVTDQCYHRCFKIFRRDERFSDYLDAPDFDYAKAFPSLQETATKRKPIVATCDGDFEVVIDPFGAAHFEDDGISYTLLNLN